MSAKAEKSVTIEIVAHEVGIVRACIRGASPLICNRMSEKAKRQLLLGGGKKSAAEKRGVAKHNPLIEFREAAYISSDPSSATLLRMPAVVFKKAAMGAAVDIPGAAKAQIGRLMFVPGEYVPIYGTPKLHMSITRSADMARTPDVRTRVIVPEWATIIEVRFVQPALNRTAVANLLGAAGITQGVGDWRQEKGSGSFGQFSVVSDDDADFVRIVSGGGRTHQIAAMEAAEPYDDETRELLGWFDTERERRGLRLVS